MTELEEKLDQAHKLVSQAGTPLCWALTLHKIKPSQLKLAHSKLLEALLLVEEILKQIQK